jgi:hypothetical protein|tara:strand:- start:1678 stop:3921 length:2244 start_codon:yes stop_codon:yes gene_type:complete
MAANQSSPGVVIQERDLTTITTLSTANTGVIAAPFELGPVEEIKDIGSERELVATFGEPNEYNYEYWYTAAQFLSYGGVLKTVRVDSTNLKNAVNTGTAVKIKNLQDYETTYLNGSNSWKWAARTPGAKGNSIGIFVTDAGADQIAVVPAPGSGNDHEFVATEALSATSGAAGKVFKYSVLLTVGSVVGSFVPGTTTTISISGSAQTVNVLAYDSAAGKIEIGMPSGGITGIIADGQTVTQGSNTAVIGTGGIERRVYIVKDKGSIDFAAADSITDTNSTAVAISSVRVEYDEREYLPTQKWVNVAPRPGTSSYASANGGFRDEMHILVIDVDGKITGNAGTLLERYVGVSKASDAKSSVGETNFYVEVIQQKSEYVYWGEHETGLFDVDSGTGTFGLVGTTSFDLLLSSAGSTNYPAGDTTIGSKGNSTYYYRLINGVDYANSGGSYTVSQGDVTTGYSLLEDPESQTIDFILTGPSGADDAAALAKITALAAIVDERRDCMLFVSPRRGNLIGVSSAATQTDNLISFFDQLPSSSYIVFDSGYKYIYDKYNDVYRYVPCNGDIAGLCLQTTEVAEPWFSPAGFQRGIVRNAIKLAYTPNKTQRDRLYSARINPVVSFPGQGIVLFGDKTAQGFASAFDRINVRRLFLTIERVISGAAKSQLFEQNDETQRGFFLNIVEPYLRDVQGRRGVTDFLVKCDESNNPPESVDRGEFNAEIYVKPTRTINYITLTFVATRTGVAFTEVAN